MLVGLKRFEDSSGTDNITFEIQGTAEELRRVYNKEYVEIEIENPKNDERYNPETEEDYEVFLNDCLNSIDDMEVDEDEL